FKAYDDTLCVHPPFPTRRSSELIVAPEVADSIPGVPRYPQADGSVKLSAAWLIERAGFKGYRLGGAGVSERHALVLVNHGGATLDRKSTRLNSSHVKISYAGFCL